MKFEWLIQDQIAHYDSGKDLLFQEVGLVCREGFQVIITFDRYDYSIIWRIDPASTVRHYQFPLSAYPIPTSWELEQFYDFITYETAHSRKTLFWSRETITLDLLKEFIETRFTKEHKMDVIDRPHLLTHCRACTEGGCETEWLCHTSSVDDAQKILQSGFLLSAGKAREMSGADLALEARNAAGDPPDYFDYVMFSYGNCIAGDRLVTERRLGRQPLDPDLRENFVPGVRFYFRYDDLIEHPGYVRDGYHPCKIRDSVDLHRYLTVCIIPSYNKDMFRGLIHTGLEHKIIYLYHRERQDIYDWTHQTYQTVKNGRKTS